MFSKKVILAIDDVAVNLAVIRGILSNDYDVRFAKSGELALYILGSVKVDLILLDIEMPGMSGFEFMEVIKQLPDARDIPVVIVTSHVSTDFISRASTAGVKEYIVKPYNALMLKDKVAKILQS